MSLDVYLRGETRRVPCECPNCWTTHERDKTDEYYSRNITHNLGKMASEAGIYEHLWGPDEIGITTAGQLIEPLRAGLERLRANPEHFKQFDPPNKWGDYHALVAFVRSYLTACEEYPTANVTVSR